MVFDPPEHRELHVRGAVGGGTWHGDVPKPKSLPWSLLQLQWGKGPKTGTSSLPVWAMSNELEISQETRLQL